MVRGPLLSQPNERLRTVPRTEANGCWLHPASDPEDVRMRRLYFGEPQPTALLDREPGLLDPGLSLAGGVAVPERARPERRVGRALQREAEPVVGGDMLVEAQLTAGAQHSMHLSKGDGRVGNGAQHERAD